MTEAHEKLFKKLLPEYREQLKKVIRRSGENDIIFDFIYEKIISLNHSTELSPIDFIGKVGDEKKDIITDWINQLSFEELKYLDSFFHANAEHVPNHYTNMISTNFKFPNLLFQDNETNLDEFVEWQNKLKEPFNDEIYREIADRLESSKFWLKMKKKRVQNRTKIPKTDLFQGFADEDVIQIINYLEKMKREILLKKQGKNIQSRIKKFGGKVLVKVKDYGTRLGEELRTMKELSDIDLFSKTRQIKATKTYYVSFSDNRDDFENLLFKVFSKKGWKPEIMKGKGKPTTKLFLRKNYKGDKILYELSIQYFHRKTVFSFSFDAAIVKFSERPKIFYDVYDEIKNLVRLKL